MYNRRITKDEVVANLVNLRQLTFEVTDDCNLQCKYCGYGDLYFGYDKRDANYMTFNQVKLLLDYLIGIWKTHYTKSEKQKTYISFYGGEPLMNMNLIQRTVEYLEHTDVKRNFILSMTTNAMLLDRYMDYIVEKRIFLLISLDGNREGHSYRVTKNGDNSFERVFANVKRLQQIYPKYFKECVNFNSVLHNRNSVEKTFEFIKNEFGKQPAINELNNSGIRPDRVEEFNKTYRNKAEDLSASENYAKLSEDMFLSEPKTSDLLLYLHQYSGNVFKNYNSLFVDKKNLNYTPTGTCSPFLKKMFVTTNGKILQCERISHQFTLGHVSDSGVCLDIDHIVSRFNEYLDKLQTQCNRCYRKESCIQCIYYIETIDSNCPVCHGFMNKEQFEQYSSYCLNHLAKHPHLYKRLIQGVLVE